MRLNKDNLPFNHLSEMIHRKIVEYCNTRAQNPIIIPDDNDDESDDDDDTVPHPSQYMVSGIWEEV